MQSEMEHPQPGTGGDNPEETPASADMPETDTEAQADAGEGFAEQPFPQEEEIDLNLLFPREEEDQDLNELFPEKELRTLLKKVHKSRHDLHKINTRFVDDTEHVVPQAKPEIPED